MTESRKVLEKSGWLWIHRTQGGRPSRSVDSSMRRWVRERGGRAVAVGMAGDVLEVWSEDGKFRQRSWRATPEEIRALRAEIDGG